MDQMIVRLIEKAKEVCGTFSLESDFSAASVGAAILSETGSIYTGVCVDLACGLGFCAEHAAVAEMLKNRETRIEMVVSVSEFEIISPCGRCREMMVQLNEMNRQARIILSPNRVVLLEDLLPEHWSIRYVDQ